MYNPEDWDQSEQNVWSIFRYTCIICLHPADVIHEIEPKSRRPRDWWKFENRALLCSVCHNLIHRNGTNQRNIQELKDIRQQRLDQYGFS